MENSSSLDDLLARMENLARACRLTVDEVAYVEASRPSERPILYAGNLHARLAFLGRDLGREEVAHGQPLIGGAGKRVRKALYHFATGREPSPGEIYLPGVLNVALLTNTVPYKPVGNKAYSPDIRDRFRPLVAEFLTKHWTGDRVVTLGTEAFFWFAPFAPFGKLDELWKRKDRYEAEIECSVEGRTMVVAPLPHPSPLNRTYWAQFPGLMENRLQTLLGR